MVNARYVQVLHTTLPMKHLRLSILLFSCPAFRKLRRIPQSVTSLLGGASEDPYAVEYKPPGETESEIYQQLSGLPYRHLAHQNIALGKEIGCGYVNNIHQARVNIGWYLASAIWPEVCTVDRVHIFAEPQARQISTRSTVRTEGHITS